VNGAPANKASTGNSASLSIPDSLLVVAGPGVSLWLFGNTLMTRDAVDGRFKLLALLVILGVALAGIVPDFELLPAVSRLAHRVRTLTLIAHLHNPSPLRRTATIDGLRSSISSFGVHNCLVDLNCARLC
jgi:hypothetical protein